ncbi:MAG: response regulator transcription factor [Pseudobdellovibrionaceae bacterium]
MDVNIKSRFYANVNMELNSAKTHILVIDDDARIRTLLMRYLQDQGFLVSVAEDAKDATAILKSLAFDLLIVDVMMPGMSGFEFARAHRELSDVPILFLTARSEIEDKVEGFGAGGDDYLAKPFEPQELLMRIGAILRRRASAPVRAEKRQVGPWMYESKRAELTHDNGEAVRLTEVENRLLEALVQRQGRIVTREDLCRILDMEAQDRTIDVQVTRLRKKIEDNPKVPRLLQTVRGKGYVLHA